MTLGLVPSLVFVLMWKVLFNSLSGGSVPTSSNPTPASQVNVPQELAGQFNYLP